VLDLGEGLVERDAVAVFLRVHQHAVAVKQQRRRQGDGRRTPVAHRRRRRRTDDCRCPPAPGAEAERGRRRSPRYATWNALLTGGGSWDTVRVREVAPLLQRGRRGGRHGARWFPLGGKWWRVSGSARPCGCGWLPMRIRI